MLSSKKFDVCTRTYFTYKSYCTCVLELDIYSLSSGLSVCETGSRIRRYLAFYSCHTDKKENKFFPIYKEIQSGAFAKSYMRKGFPIYEEMGKYFPIYKEAVSYTYMTLQLLHSEFPYIWGNFDFLFYQCIHSRPVVNPFLFSLPLSFYRTQRQ